MPAAVIQTTIRLQGEDRASGAIKSAAAAMDDAGKSAKDAAHRTEEIAEKSGSAPVYALLKRTDERHVTMQAYDNPVFVEDVVRNAAALLLADKRVASFTVKAVNQESIHDHNAFAVISGKAEGI